MLLFFLTTILCQHEVHYDLSGTRDEITISGEGSIEKLYLDKLSITNSLVTCTIQSNISEIPSSCFEGYVKLKNCYLPPTLKIIGEKAFYKCYGLKSLIIPEGVTSIKYQTLMYTQSLEELYIPSTLISFDMDMSFYQNGAMSTFKVAENNPKYSTDSEGHFLMNKNQTILYSSHTVSVVTIPDCIEIISSKFIYERGKIKTIIFSKQKNLKRIEDYAFQYAAGLTSLELPEGLEYLGANFATSAPIETITLPSTLSTINPESFSGLKKLKQIYTSQDNQYLFSDGFALYNKNKTILYFITSLAENLTIPSSVETIPQTMIQYATSLVNVTIEGSGKYTDYNNLVYTEKCSKLFACPGNRTIAYIHPDCKYILDSAFSYCAIKEVIFEGAKLLQIGTNSFCYSKIESISLPESFETFISFSFRGCESLKSVIISSKLKYLGGYTFHSSSIEQINMSACTGLLSIDQSVFSYCTKLRRVILPPNLQTISTGAFSYCTAISQINFPSSVSLISTNAFNGCTNLSSATFESESNLLEIGQGAFVSNNFTTFSLPNSCKKLGEESFSNCKNLSTFEINDGSKLTTIMPKIFSGTKITLIFFGKALETISPTAFTGAEFLTDVEISSENTFFTGDTGIVYTRRKDAVVACTCGRESVMVAKTAQFIWPSAFFKCTKLTTVTFASPSQLRVINESTFVQCKMLTVIKLPAMLEEIKSLAFQGCTGLKTVTVEQGSVLDSICDTAFSGCNLLSTFEFKSKSKVTKIGKDAFNGCPLSEFDFSSIVSIGDNSFSGTQMKSLHLPQSAQIIGTSAFANSPLLESVKVWSVGASCFASCPKLTKVEFCGTSIPSVSFLGGNSQVKIYVPFSFIGNSIESITVEKVFDGDCQIGTSAFSSPLSADILSYELFSLLLEQSNE